MRSSRLSSQSPARLQTGCLYLDASVRGGLRRSAGATRTASRASHAGTPTRRTSSQVDGYQSRRRLGQRRKGWRSTATNGDPNAIAASPSFTARNRGLRRKPHINRSPNPPGTMCGRIQRKAAIEYVDGNSMCAYHLRANIRTRNRTKPRVPSAYSDKTARRTSMPLKNIRTAVVPAAVLRGQAQQQCDPDPSPQRHGPRQRASPPRRAAKPGVIYQPRE